MARIRSISKPVYSLEPSFWNSNGAKVGSVPTRRTFAGSAFLASSLPPQPATIKDKAAKTAIAISKYFFILQPPEKYLDCTQHAALYIC